MAKTAPKSAQKSLEDAAWGTSPKASKPALKKKPKAETGLKATVTVREVTKKTASPAKAGPDAPRHVVAKVGKDDQTVPMIPTDFAAASEMKGFLADVDDANAGIQKILGDRQKLPGKAGLDRVIALQPSLDKILKEQRLKPEERSALNNLIQKRDTALYMYSAGLLAQKKNGEAGPYLRFLSKSGSSDTPLRDAAAQELAQIGG
jgi:hypothetical protein